MVHDHLHPDATAHVESILRQTRLANDCHHLLNQAIACVRLMPAEGSSRAGFTQIGGLPSLPRDIDWPRWDASAVYRDALAHRLSKMTEYQRQNETYQSINREMERQIEKGERGLAFLAQIDLSEVPMPELLGLPGEGILWFFADPELHVEERESWRVVYRDDVRRSDLRTGTPPANTALFKRLPAYPSPGAHFLPDATLLDGSAIEELPITSQAEPSMDTFLESDSDDWQQDWLDAIAQVPLPDQAPANWMRIAQGRGGLHPHPILGDACASPDWNRPRLHASSILADVPRAERPAASNSLNWQQIEVDSKQWRGLLSIDSDERRFGKSWMWGDAGQLQFWIRHEDLANRRFDQVQLYVDTT